MYSAVTYRNGKEISADIYEDKANAAAYLTNQLCKGREKPNRDVVFSYLLNNGYRYETEDISVELKEMHEPVPYEDYYEQFIM